MNLVVRKLSMLKNTIEEKEINSKITGLAISETELKLKNNIDNLLSKLYTIQ